MNNHFRAPIDEMKLISIRECRRALKHGKPRPTGALMKEMSHRDVKSSLNYWPIVHELQKRRELRETSPPRAWKRTLADEETQDEAMEISE